MIGGGRKARLGVAALIAISAGLQPVELLAAAPVSPKSPARFSIRWIPQPSATNRVAVEVFGLGDAALQALRQTNWTIAQWQRLFAVHAEQGDLFADVGRPPMLGVYRVEAGFIRFYPQFALAPGLSYQAAFYPGQLPGARDAGPLVSSVFTLFGRQTGPGTVVTQIHPTAGVLPENLLKFYVHFSGPMSGGHIYEHIHLRNDVGHAVELPFLEIDEELWDPEMTRLTLFIDPGRIKRGVQPLEEIGPALEEGRSYTLAIDRDWKDAAGQPLKGPFQKTFRVGPPARQPLDPVQWKISSPRPGTRVALAVDFPAPLDHALARRLIRVARESGEIVEGATALEDQERRWTFTPAQPWQRGPHRLLVQTTIEDLAGNNIGKSFEVDLFEPVQRRMTNSTVRITFQVR